MDSKEELSRTLSDIEARWKDITATPTPPRSLMNVIQYGLGDKKRGEVYVTRLLRYLLDPSEPHGMDTRFLKAFLDGFSDQFVFEEPVYDLSDVRVRDEVWIRMEKDDQDSDSSNDSDGTDGDSEDDSDGTTDEDDAEDDDMMPSGRVDLAIDKPGKWFLLIELKFSAEENNLAGEGLSQTEFYRDATHIDDTPKSDYENDHYYLYLHKSDADTAEDEQAFVNWTWENVTTEVVKPFINTEGASIPHRTFVQLNELQDDIKEFTDMTAEKPNTEEKVELYLDNYTVLNDLQQTFEARWTEFTGEWHSNLAAELDEYVDTEYEVDDGIIAVQLDAESTGETWYLRAKHKDWQPLFKHGWWKPVDKDQWEQGGLEGLPRKASGDTDTLRVLYVHRMDSNRDAAIENNTLIVNFRNAGANPKPFYDEFSKMADLRKHEILDALPDSAHWLGNKSNQFELRYDIPEPDPKTEAAPDDFFEAYTAALRDAFVELIVEHPEATKVLTEIYDNAVKKHMN